MIVPIVGLGASAGGLEAFSSLLSHLPANTGLALVFVQHLDPKHPSNLAEILARVSAIPVRQVTDGMQIEGNHLFVLPPDAELEISGSVLKMKPRAPAASGPHLPINHFLRSLAQECGSRAIGVILSGAGSDGAAGLDAVKSAGGMTFAQEPATARFDSMPQAAISSGCVDWVLPPEAIAAELAKLGRHPYFSEDEDSIAQGPVAKENDQFGPMLTRLRDATGIDFTLYREGTIQRRIRRRMALRNTISLEEYRAQIENDPRELSALHRDLLIGITCFFRDPDSFENLKKFVLPRVVRERPPNAAIRIWVPGCATGEEAYSLAISLQEYFEATGQVYPVQIFASDVSTKAIEKARSGKYPDAIAVDVSPERLSRHFLKVEGGYQVSKALREMCICSRHDLTQDPAFSKLDVISCRNVLIFFGSVRKNIIARFHYALNPGGFLVLGVAETAAGSLFSAVEGVPAIYVKKEIVGKGRRALYAPVSGARPGADASRRVAGSPLSDLVNRSDLRKEWERALLARYGGAGVVVDETLEVLEVLGQTAPFLALPTGKLSFNLLKLIPDTRLFLEVEKLVREVATSGEAAQKKGIPYRGDGTAEEVDVEVIPLSGTQAHAHALLVLFEATHGVLRMQPDLSSDPREREIATLKQDLAEARQRLLSIIEEHQSSGEEGQNAMEEAVSANEELQSLNEELETAKEELQSTNEELATVNQELMSNNAALKESHDFAMLIIETAAAPLLVLDIDLRIKAANPAFYRTFRLSRREAEGQILYSVGNGCWDIPRLREMLEGILPDHKAVQDFEIEQYFPVIGPRVLALSARQLDGLQQILLGIEDVTDRKNLDLRLSAIVESSDDAILATNIEGTIVSWNAGAEVIYGYAAREAIGQPIKLLVPPGQEEETASIMQRIQRGKKLRHFETRRRRKDGEIIDVSVTISPIVGQNGTVRGASIVARDITEQKRRQQEAVAKQKLESVGTLAGGIAHDFNNLLGGILAHSELALAELADGLRPEDQLKGIRAVAIRGAEIVRQLMIYAGQESEILELVDVSRIVQDMLELLKVSISKHASLETDLAKDLPLVRASSSQIGQVVMNLITNASDALGERDGVISVTTRQVAVDRNSSLHTTESLAEGDYVRLDVSDTGRGMTAEIQARVFEPFFTTKPAGHGLGLAVVHGIVRSLNGGIRLVSTPGNGTTFQVLLPCAERRAEPAHGTISRDQEAKPLPRKATILFVEDEPALLQAASKMFQKKGLTVIEAADGTAALDLMRAHQEQIDVLFLDVTLPGASSSDVLEVARRLRPGMPVIVTSANSEENARASLSGTFERFIRKPYRIGNLVDTVCDLLFPGNPEAT